MLVITRGYLSSYHILSMSGSRIPGVLRPGGSPGHGRLLGLLRCRGRERELLHPGAGHRNGEKGAWFMVIYSDL